MKLNLRTNEFHVAIRSHESSFLYEDANLLKEYKILKNPFSLWIADPFVANINGKHYIFAEGANKITGKGKIIYGKIQKNKIKWKTLIKNKYHMSFPNIHLLEEGFYIIPETHQNKTLEKYLFTNEFKLTKKEIIKSNVDYVDSLQINNDLFLSYSVENQKKLILWGRSNIYDELVDNDDVFRPAGKLIENKVSILPMQDGRYGYGSGLFFNILELTDNKISINTGKQIDIHFIQKLFNNKNINGIHSYNFDDKYEVIDIKKYELSLLGFIGKILTKFKIIKAI